MESISRILNQKGNTACSYEEYIQKRCDWFNSKIGHLEGYDCPKCLNRGYIKRVKNRHEIIEECECMYIRRNNERIRKSGLSESIEECTFEKYNVSNKWQQNIKAKAQAFINDKQVKWFYMGGQVGCGKTHICTAIMGELLKRKYECYYMLWLTEATKIKADVLNSVEYEHQVNKLRNVKVLYIDDLFKTQKDEDGKQKKVTNADVKIAFDILNYRYINKKLITIISTEKSIDDLIDIDEGVGSRVLQMSKEYCLSIGEDRGKNYRLNGGK